MSDRTIIHLSDQHLDDRGHPDIGPEDGHLLADAIIDREDPESAVIVDTGDFVGSGEQQQFTTAAEVVSRYRRAGFVYVITGGNHDYGWKGQTRDESAVESFRGFAAEVADNPTDVDYPHVHVSGDVCIILLDSCVDGTKFARGVLGRRQLRRLRPLVRHARSRGYRVVLAMHHCTSANGPGLDAALVLEDRHALGDTLEEVGGVDLMLTGHLHQACQWSGVFGADYLLASPMVTREQCYRRIWWEGDRLEWEWVSV